MNKFVNQTMRLLFTLTLSFGLLTGISYAQQMEKKDDAMMKKDDKPTVAIVKADWCGACKKLDPTMMKLMEDYKDKLNFVVFDVTNEKTIAKAMEIAKEKGLEEFLKENKEKTSTVAIFKSGKNLFKTQYNQDREAYIKEFDKSLEK